MKRTLFIIVLISLLFITACTNNGGSDLPTGRYVGGDDGLKISFVEGEPPESVLDDRQETFDISILAENVGEEDIAPNQIIITLNGIERDAFKLRSLTEKNDIELLGEKKLRDRIQDGESTEVRFKDANYQELLPFDFPVEIRADVCYEYGTTAVADICLKNAASERRTDDQCEIDNDNVNIENSGAPVHIEQFTQRARGSNALQFTFDIVKAGSGDVYPTGTFKDSCGVNYDVDDQVNVDISFLSRSNNPNIDCSTLNGHSGIVRLISGKKTVRCTVSTAGLQDIAFERPLRIKLDYMYKDSEETSFLVESTEDQ